MTTKPSLQIQFSIKNLLVFLVFFFLMHELHEQAHMITGRLICGCWGTRDFNVWDLCADCLNQKPIAIIATFAGPVFTFTMLWTGWYWLKYGKTEARRSLGLVFILGNMQFGRMYMAATGSGDEVWGLKHLFLNAGHSNFEIIRAAGFLIVSAICLPPLITAYKAIANKRKVLIYISFLLIPLVLDTVVILILLNSFLEKGLLNYVWIMGTPLLITIWLVICLLVTGINFKSLKHFARDTDR
jgi:hypothetical protein